MRQDIKDRWVAALRSGEYGQTEGYLANDDNSFCCLGVLCDIVKDEVGGTWDEVEDGLLRFNTGSDSGLSLPPTDVVVFAELFDENPIVKIEIEGEERNISLAELNDQGWTFAKIADIIEEKL